MKDLGIFKVAIALLALTAAGCAGQGGTPSVGPAAVSSVTRQEAASVAPDGKKKFAGKYNGPIGWSKGSVTYSGTLETILRFHYKNILGPFRITANGKTHNYRLGGRIKSKTSEEAQIVFTIYNTKGGYATGSGTIANGTFAGTAHSVSVGEDPSVSLNFSATKSQKD